MQNRVFEPISGAIGTDVYFEDRRKSAEDRPAEVWVARHVSAHEARFWSAAAGAQGTQVTRFDLFVDPVVGEGPLCTPVAAHVVSIPMGKDHDVSGFEV